MVTVVNTTTAKRPPAAPRRKAPDETEAAAEAPFPPSKKSQSSTLTTPADRKGPKTTAGAVNRETSAKDSTTSCVWVEPRLAKSAIS